MESVACVSSEELIHKSAAPGMHGFHFHSATLLLMLAVGIVISISEPTWDTAESIELYVQKLYNKIS